MSVVFPDPFGPSRIQRSPGRIIQSIGPRIVRPVRRTTTPARATTGASSESGVNTPDRMADRALAQRAQVRLEAADDALLPLGRLDGQRGALVSARPALGPVRGRLSARSVRIAGIGAGEGGDRRHDRERDCSGAIRAAMQRGLPLPVAQRGY